MQTMSLSMTSKNVVPVSDSEQLSLTEYDELVSILQEGAFDNEALTRALDALRVYFRGNYVTLILKVVGIEELGLMLVAGNYKEHGRLCYQAYQEGSTPFGHQPADTVFTELDVLSEADWQTSHYYRELCRNYNVYHLMGADISTPDSGLVRLRITRPHNSPEFDARDREVCQMLLPHLRRSLHMHNLLNRSEMIGTLYSQAITRLSVATIVLDKGGSVLQLNAVAQELLERADGLKLVGGRLEATYPSDNRELHKLINEAFAAHQGQRPLERDALSISRPSGEVNLGVVAEAMPSVDWVEGKGQPAVVLYVRDSVGRSQVNNTVAKQLFNFTPAETALALELANGLSLEEAAENLNIMRNTARAHLRAIFSKTGVRRQAELVRVMLNSVVALGGSQLAPLKIPVVTLPRPRIRDVC